MSVVQKINQSPLFRFFSQKRNQYLILLLLIIGVALVDYFSLGLTRKTFVYYSAFDGAVLIEERMFRSSSSQETDIRRYIEEALLGSVSPDAAPFFSPETRLQSLLFRDRVVYANFSESALIPVLPPAQGVYLGFLTLNEGIRRNFSKVKDVKFFINGREIFSNEFSKIFAEHADNDNKTGQ